MWGTILPWIPLALSVAEGVNDVLHQGLTGPALWHALFGVLIGAFIKARGTTGGKVAVTQEAAERNALPGATSAPAK